MAYYENPERSERRARRSRNVDLSSIGLAFPIATMLGYWLGSAIGGWFDVEKAGGLVGMGFGIVAGFYNVYKVVVRLNKQQDEDDRLAREEVAGGSDSEGSGADEP
jgi:hypothetical protein